MTVTPPHSHLLSIHDLSVSNVESLLERAQYYVNKSRSGEKKSAILHGKTLVNLFFENSTRTRTSFEIAGKRLGADVVNVETAISSISKGETLIDTVQTLDAMGLDALIVRHPESGAADLIRKHIRASVINAGDGCNEHPTQALLDALTILQFRPSLKDLTITICGDIRHSRVAHSSLLLYKMLGAKLRVLAPPTLIPTGFTGAEVFHNREDAVRGADIIVTLRLQKERMSGCYIPSLAEYHALYGISHRTIKLAKPDVLVLDPGPVMRGLQITAALADDKRHSKILTQVEMGVALRQAVLEWSLCR